MTEVEILFRENYMPLVHYLMKMVSKEDAEEIAVDCIYKVSTLKDKIVTKSFIFVVARNMVIDFTRKRKRYYQKHQQLIKYLQYDDSDFIETEVLEAYTLKSIYEAYAKLPIGARVILKLYFLGLKTTEIASRLHITARTVLNQKSRAIKLIKEAVAQ